MLADLLVVLLLSPVAAVIAALAMAKMRRG
jgi:hypothetical protein